MATPDGPARGQRLRDAGHGTAVAAELDRIEGLARLAGGQAIERASRGDAADGLEAQQLHGTLDAAHAPALPVIR